jgi:hypothetical protein
MFYSEKKITDLNLINSLKKEVKNNVKEFLTNNTNVKGQMTFYRHFIDNKLFKIIEETTLEYKWYDAWGTILKKGQHVSEHNHIQPGTYFKNHNITIKPEIGKIIIFSCKEAHSVAKYEGDEERITIAFNGRKREEYELN